MRLGTKDRLFVLTGAGISAESGLPIFRGTGGLWNGHKVEDVATPYAWNADPEFVWRFYSMRRRDALAVQPNAAHFGVAQLEKELGKRFYLCTQNVDDLHERGGSKRLRHMHGSLFESRCVSCGIPFSDCGIYEYTGALPRCADCGDLVRPNVVWFGEMPLGLPEIYRQLELATVLLVVGTSGSVYPAAGFVDTARRHGTKTMYVGPEIPLNADSFDEVIEGSATEVVPELF